MQRAATLETTQSSCTLQDEVLAKLLMNCICSKASARLLCRPVPCVEFYRCLPLPNSRCHRDRHPWAVPARRSATRTCSAKSMAQKEALAPAAPVDDKLALQMLDFINSAWSPFHAVGASRGVCYSLHLLRSGLREAVRPKSDQLFPLKDCHHVSAHLERRVRWDRRGEQAPAGRRLQAPLRARGVGPASGGPLLLHPERVHDRGVRHRRGLPPRQRLPHARRAHRQVPAPRRAPPTLAAVLRRRLAVHVPEPAQAAARYKRTQTVFVLEGPCDPRTSLCRSNCCEGNRLSSSPSNQLHAACAQPVPEAEAGVQGRQAGVPDAGRGNVRRRPVAHLVRPRPLRRRPRAAAQGRAARAPPGAPPNDLACPFFLLPRSPVTRCARVLPCRAALAQPLRLPSNIYTKAEQHALCITHSGLKC